MTRKFRTLGLALVAAFAMSALVASAAQAFEGTWHSEAANTTLTAGQTTTHEFTAGEGFGAISCKKAEFSGSTTEATTTYITITPAYSECKDSFGRTVDVHINGMHYRFHLTEHVPSPITFWWAHVDLVCETPGCGSIVLEVTSGGTAVCTVTIGAQTGVGPVKVLNEGNKVNIVSEANNVKSTTSGGFFNCGIANGEHTNGTYTGSSLTTGTSEGKEVRIWAE
jgi:hypothetical protein